MNAKGDLIAKLLSLGQGAPEFDVVTAGPPHERTFQVSVRVGGRVLGGGEARSKRDAERIASEVALRGLEGRGLEGRGLEGGRPEAAPSQAGGVWPIYSPVLAGALEAALDLCPEDASVDDVRAEAARLYRDLLRDLGHGPE